MVQAIAEHSVIRPHQGRQHTNIRRVTTWKHKSRFGSFEVSDRRFQTFVPFAAASHQRTGTGAGPHASHLSERLANAFVIAEPKVIVAGKVQQPTTIAFTPTRATLRNTTRSQSVAGLQIGQPGTKPTV